MKVINESFSPEVSEQLKKYVYRLIDPRNGETFYVGRGKGNRVFDHIKGTLSKKEDEDRMENRIERIKSIQNSGLEVLHIIHRHGMDNDSVKEVEASLIDAYAGLTNIMGGHGSNDFGPMNTQEVIAKYTAPEAEINHKLVMIVLSPASMDLDLYQAVRFAWRINKSRAEQADYVLAVVQGIVRGVYQPTEWMSATKENFGFASSDVEGRYGFEGVPAPKEIAANYIGKRIPDDYRKKGASNPVKYSY